MVRSKGLPPQRAGTGAAVVGSYYGMLMGRADAGALGALSKEICL